MENTLTRKIARGIVFPANLLSDVLKNYTTSERCLLFNLVEKDTDPMSFSNTVKAYCHTLIGPGPARPNTHGSDLRELNSDSNVSVE